MNDAAAAAKDSVPLKEMPAEARRIIDRARENGVQLRLMGGIAVRFHCAELSFCDRPYSDIDLMGLGSQSPDIMALFNGLGYVPDKAFNALHGAQRLKFEDHHNNRHTEVFLDVFRMDQTLDFRGRLEIDPYTISLTDLLLTKLQVVKLDLKDFHDMFSLFRGHKVGIDDREGVFNARYIAHLCAQDWGLYHTVLRNLERIPDYYDDFKLDNEERQSMDRRIWVLKLMIIEEPKGPFWRARAGLGERVPYHEEIDHVTGEE